MRDYGKVFTSFWTSETTREMSEDGRVLALYLLTCPHMSLIGAARLPDGYVCDDLQWSLERVTEGFQNTHAKGFATRFEPSKWVIVHEYLRWNEIENPNQAKSAVKLLYQIPDTVSGKKAIALILLEQCRRFSEKNPEICRQIETLLEGLDNRFLTSNSNSNSNSIKREGVSPIGDPTRAHKIILDDKTKHKTFVPPTLDEVQAYCATRQNKINAGKFLSHYQANGWMVGKSRMRDWQAAIRSWEQRENEFKPPGNGTKLKPMARMQGETKKFTELYELVEYPGEPPTGVKSG